MPRARASRVAEPESYPDSESDTEPEGDPEETPRKGGPKPRVKRRVSAYALDASDNASQGQISTGNASKSTSAIRSINDDMAEKRMRRKSTKLNVVADPSSSKASKGDDGDGDEDDVHKTPGKKTTGRGNAPRTPRRTGTLLSTVDRTPIPAVPIEISTSNFEEWMKLATDNKINANNSWQFALIDYFHEMSVLRNETDNTINFQKASRTLDGCVKIWTSRVDSVGTDTGKLLSNLANEGGRDDGDEDGEDGGGDGEGGHVKKKKAHRPEATLAKNPAQLRTKKLDLEFTVDPLFKKTCADFDEGGAQGLLMNHLGVDGNIRVVFDAGDSGDRDEEEGEGDVGGKIDFTQLRAKFSLAALEDKTIGSTRLRDFHFSSDPTAVDDTMANATFEDDTQIDMGGDFDSGDENDFGHGNTGGDEGPIDVEGGGGGGGEEDFFTGDQAVNDDFYGGGDDYPVDGGEPGPAGVAGGAGGGPGRIEPFDPRQAPDERGLVMSMTEEGETMMDYFDSSITKSWAGPEHWKLRKVVRRPDASADTSAAPKQKREKQAFQIEFGQSTEVTIKELFAPSTSKIGLTLPAKSGPLAKKGAKKGANEKRDNFTLPDDMHFSSRQLLTLFLKPKFSLKMRNQKAQEVQDGEVDDQFWAQAAADGPGGGDDHQLPFATQFLNDQFDDDDGYPGLGDDVGGEPGNAVEEEEDLLAATQGTQLKRARPEFVNYAKRVKRVDVRKLKENIWKGLEIIVPPKDGDEEDELQEEKEPTDPTEAREFTSVIQGLRTTYPQDKMKDISTSFCFICLLHLANERGLKIEGDSLGEEDEDTPVDGDVHEKGDAESKKEAVGDIWSLKIYRDPDAVPSA